MLDLNQALRELRRLLSGEPASNLCHWLDHFVARAEMVSHLNEFDEIAQVCVDEFNTLSRRIASELGTQLPELSAPQPPEGISTCR
jgi:hypothetical protein